MTTHRFDFVAAFVEELVRCGVQHACVCPGSRSTPLAIFLRRCPRIHVWTHLDERSAAFFALGMAKVSHQPVAVLSTSGTAAVNFAPAVVEASHARVPLLLLTADRPPELHDVGAPQTIDQQRLYGTFVRWFVDMSLPDGSEAAVRFARNVAARAVAITAAPHAPGPVHINFPLREPLLPDCTNNDLGAGPSLQLRRRSYEPDPHTVTELAAELSSARRGLIVCGPQDDPELPAAATRLAHITRFPILAGPLSSMRAGHHHCSLIIASYDALLREDVVATSLQPDLILRLGTAPVSKALLRYLASCRSSRQAIVAVHPCGPRSWTDPTLATDLAVDCDPRRFCEALVARISGSRSNDAPPSSQWSERWIELDAHARKAIRTVLASEPTLTEPGVFAELAEILPDGATLFVGNSMPLRDADSFFVGRKETVRFLANRGASGIDGVVSTALGAVAAGERPLVLVLGDLSFYHDMNGLLAARRHRLSATIVLLNNDGGGIFSFLPEAGEREHFEELFGAPHGLDFSTAAQMYDLAYRPARTRGDFCLALKDAVIDRGVTLIEVRTKRTANARLHRNLWAAVGSAVRPLLAGGRRQ